MNYNSQNLSFKQTQRVNVGQIQFLNLLHFNQVELDNHITTELLENPFLEPSEITPEVDINENDRDEDFTKDLRLDEMYSREILEDDDGFAKQAVANREDNSEWQDYKLNSQTEDQSLSDYVYEQVKYCGLNESQLQIAHFLINSVNEKGFLDANSGNITDNLGFALGKFFDETEVSHVKEIINHCEPFGYATYDLTDYLTFLVLNESEIKDEIKENAVIILEKYLEVLGKNNWDILQEKSNLSQQQIMEVWNLISGFNPYPTIGYDRGELQALTSVIPDYEIFEIDGQLHGELIVNKNYNLKVNSNYAESLKTNQRNSSNSYINEKLQSAYWLINAIEQREETMTKVIQSIVYLQNEYLLTGDNSQLKPMKLKDIADLVGLTISTVSRVTSNKYAISPIGVINLKSLFTEAIHLDNGTTKSNKEVQEMVIDILKNENKMNPYSDLEVQKELEKQGIQLIRRTITKYRIAGNIPSSKERK